MKIEEQQGVEATMIRLIFNGKNLADENTIGDYNIAPGAMVHIVLNMKGGF